MRTKSELDCSTTQISSSDIETSKSSLLIVKVNQYVQTIDEEESKSQTQVEERKSLTSSPEKVDMDEHMTIITGLQKQLATLKQENEKLMKKAGVLDEEKGGYCSGCKVELLFQNSERSNKTLDEEMSEQSDMIEPAEVAKNFFSNTQTFSKRRRSHAVSNTPLSSTENKHLESLKMLAEENNDMKLQLDNMRK